jgi:hypothetical protein
MNTLLALITLLAILIFSPAVNLSCKSESDLLQSFINFPVFPSNNTISQSVLDAGQDTSPPPALLIASLTALDEG